MEKKKRKMLNSFTILFLITIVMAVLTWIIPAGAYDLDEAGNFIQGTYHAVDQTPQGIWNVFTAPVYGFLGNDITDGAVQVSLFIMVIGGFLGIVNETGAIDAGIASMIKNNKNNVSKLIWALMLVFCLGGSTYGMAEETMAFYPLLIPLMVGVGMDALVAVGVVLIGSAMGCLASTVNPFATGVASDAAGISMADGLPLRLVFFLVMYVLGAWYVSSYAKKVQHDNTQSYIYDHMEADREKFKVAENTPDLTGKQKVVLWLFGLSFVIMILGLVPWSLLNENWTFFDDTHAAILGVPFLGNLIGKSSLALGNWYMVEITMLFFLMSVIIGLFYGIEEERFIDVFIAGVKDLLSVALICAVARGIQVIMNDGQITATVLHWGEQGLKGMSAGVFTVLTYLFYIPMSFLIPSTSGLAAATMGIMAPLGQFADVPKDLVVTIYQAACGVVNLITPTSGVVMGALAIAGIDISTWWKFTTKLVAFIVVLSLVLLVGASMI